MKTVIILHNMTIEDKVGSEYENDHDYHQTPQSEASITINETANQDFDAYLLRYQAIRDVHGHNRLKSDLIEHLWSKLGDNSNEP